MSAERRTRSTIKSAPTLTRADFASTSRARTTSQPVGCVDRQQEIDRHAESCGYFLMQRQRPLAFSGFEIGKITLCYPDRSDELRLGPAAPLAQRANGIVACREPIDHALWQEDLSSGSDRLARPAHDPSSADIFILRLLRESLVFALRKYGKLLAVLGFDELNLHHDRLSTVNLSTMGHSDNDQLIAFNVEDDAPFTNPQPRTCASFQTLDVALTGPCKLQKLRVEPPARIGRKIDPLSRRRSSKHNLHHDHIANCDISVNGICP